MLTRFLENLLISTFNRARDRREVKPLPPPPPPALPPPADFTVVGFKLSEEQHRAGHRIAPHDSAAEVVALSPAARQRHLYILGATGTGKTNLLMRLIESDIEHGRAFCVIDLRGDLVDRVLLRLAASAPPDVWRKRLLLLDLRDSEHVVGFNPLVGEGEPYSRALYVLSVLKTQADSWGVQLEETLRNCLLALAETGWTLLEVEPLLMNAAFRAEVLKGVSDSRVRSFFERYAQLSPANQMTWALAALNKVTPLLSIPNLRLLFGQRVGFPVRQLFDTQPGMVVLVSLAVDRLHEAAHLTGGLLVSSFQSAILSRIDVPEQDRVPVNLLVDEFETMASERFATIIAEGRRFGLGLTLSHQNLTQMPTDLRHVLRNNVHTQVYFQTGAVDAAELAKEISGGKSDEETRRTLMGQGVGRAFLVRRGEPSIGLQVLHSPDPRVPDDQVQAVREASWSTYARPRAEVAAELAEREQRYRSDTLSSPIGDPGSTIAPSASSVSSNSPPTYEIRHSKSATFKPSQPPVTPDETASSAVEISAQTQLPAKFPAKKLRTTKPKANEAKAPKSSQDTGDQSDRGGKNTP